MSKQTQATMLMVGALAGTVGLVAFVALMVLGGYAFSPALFLALLVAGAAALFLMIGFHHKPTLSVTTPKAAASPAAVPVAPVVQPVASAAPADLTRPAALSAPRDGGADDLKLIKGIGPKLEELCHSLGFYHFDQIANWTAEEIAWVDDNLEGFKGRVTRDTWVEQARVLASGDGTN